MPRQRLAGPIRRPLTFAAAALLALSGCTDGTGSKSALPDAPPVRLTADSIGPLALHLPLAELRRAWSTARDTSFHDHEAIYPAVVFQIGRVEAVAVQTRMDVDRFEPLPLRPDCPADFWQVSGVGGTIGGAISLDTPWESFLEQFGPAQLSTEMGEVRVRLEYAADWIFELEIEDALVLESVIQQGITAIPADARIRRTFLPRTADVTSGCLPQTG